MARCCAIEGRSLHAVVAAPTSQHPMFVSAPAPISPAEGRQDVCPKHVLGTCSGTGQCQGNARAVMTVLITIGRILTGHIPTKLRKRLGQGFIPFLDDLFLSNTNCAMENGLHCLDAAPV